MRKRGTGDGKTGTDCFIAAHSVFTIDGLTHGGKVKGTSSDPTQDHRGLMLKAGSFPIASCDAFPCVTSQFPMVAHRREKGHATFSFLVLAPQETGYRYSSVILLPAVGEFYGTSDSARYCGRAS